MTAKQRHERRHTATRGFLAGPVVAALFRAARRAATPPALNTK